MDFRGFDCGDYQLWKLLEMKYKNATYMMLESVAAPGLFFHIVEKEVISEEERKYCCSDYEVFETDRLQYRSFSGSMN